MPIKNIVLLTESFPYGGGETFLETEIVRLAADFEHIYIFPLTDSDLIRSLPKNVLVMPPLLSFSLKNKRKLLIKGLFNFSPWFFGVSELCQSKVLFSKSRFWNWTTNMLIIRAITSNKTVVHTLLSLTKNPEILVYSYWAHKAAYLFPILKKHHPDLLTLSRFHGVDLYLERHNGYLPFRPYLFKSLDYMVCISEHGLTYLNRHYPSQTLKTHLFRLGVADNGLNPIAYSSQSPFHIVSCSGMLAVKRLHLIIEALVLIDIQICWTHLGSGPLSGELNQAIQKLPPNVKVIFAGHKSNVEVLDFYKKTYIDIFVNVSQSEGLPVAIMEALSFGIPVLATNVGGTAELVNQQNGYLLEANPNPANIAQQILKISQTDTTDLRLAARARWAARADANKNYSAFIAFIKNLA